MTADTDFDFLISRFLDGTLSRSDASLLCNWVKQDSANADRLALASLLHSRLYDTLRSECILDDEVVSADPFADAAVMPAIHIEDSLEQVEVKLPAPQPVEPPVLLHTNAWSSLWRYRRVAAVLLIAAGIAFAIAARIFRQPPAAVIASAVNAEWDDQPNLAVGDAMPTNLLSLKSGFAEIRLRRGASVVLEGPAQVQILSDNSLAFYDGKLSAKVPASAHGFVVQTETARIVDLGTEFGVRVDGSGATAVEVFKGRVDAAPFGAQAGNVPTRLIAGQLAMVSFDGVTVQPGPANQILFVRTLAPVAAPLDVLDLISGGDGTTQLRSCNIDQNTGQISLNGPLSMRSSGGDDRIYHPIKGPAVLDGTFVPDQRSLVDSANHYFVFENGHGKSISHIYAGGAVQLPAPINGVPYPVSLGGIDYSLPPHGFVFLHANAGLTLDLAAIRRLHPGTSLKSFQAVVGNYRNQFTVQHPDNYDSQADAFVLIDGVPRFSRLGFTRKDGAISIQVPITDADRFLTLAVTEGTDGVNSDWVAFGDPHLN